MTLFTYLKIILLQCFQFLNFNNKRYPNRSLVYLSLTILSKTLYIYIYIYIYIYLEHILINYFRKFFMKKHKNN